MTPTPWAQAVEAIRKNLSGLCCDGPGCDLCMEVAQDIAKESLPHLLRAVVGALDEYDVARIRAATALMEDGVEGESDPEAFYRKHSAALLAALTDAAARLRARAEQP